MNIKNYFSEAKVCHYNLATFVAGVVAVGFSII
jgi:hypothetical protein